MRRSYVIYIIVNLDDKKVYYGHTCMKLKRRIQFHKSTKTNCKCKDFNWDNVFYEVLEYLYCDKEQARIIEEGYRSINECVNKHRAYLSKEGLKKHKKQYRLDNIDRIKQEEKEYREKNRDIINQKKRKKIQCECGIYVSNSGLARHKKSKKHITLLSHQ